MSGQGVFDGSGWTAPATPAAYRPGDRANPVPIPDVLCGINGCVYLKGHFTFQHSWEVPA